ncbi:hypothetical protein [Aridibaculum aurantiacum]|uniref:hypothetical protein n=1 Tax=Aridibaculum aurantiacum TaxID=2810307 RepID=UPI001A960DCA|nr:hypothetical protein [Aridibaculum aurantiacum]
MKNSLSKIYFALFVCFTSTLLSCLSTNAGAQQLSDHIGSWKAEATPNALMEITLTFEVNADGRWADYTFAPALSASHYKYKFESRSNELVLLDGKGKEKYRFKFEAGNGNEKSRLVEIAGENNKRRNIYTCYSYTIPGYMRK